MSPAAPSLAERLAAVRARIDAAARRVGRDPSGVTLVAVSKTHPAEAVREALAAGQTLFGENRVQEAEGKIPLVAGARWHLVGRLQRNKARRAVELFELIHSVDSPRLAETLDRLGKERGRPVEALVEINVGGEASKGGFAPDEFLAALDELAGRPGLLVRGLMTVPPPVADPEEARPYFRRLVALGREAAARALPNVVVEQYSMGMSDDFEIAVEEGATLVRVGTAIFGARDYSAQAGQK
ncbi:MAG: YggS family pyridoxal phosphate-dependent enzyme [Candidatus Polarisedimenticolia bacterium]